MRSRIARGGRHAGRPRRAPRDRAHRPSHRRRARALEFSVQRGLANHFEASLARAGAPARRRRPRHAIAPSSSRTPRTARGDDRNRRATSCRPAQPPSRPSARTRSETRKRRSDDGGRGAAAQVALAGSTAWRAADQARATGGRSVALLKKSCRARSCDAVSATARERRPTRSRAAREAWDVPARARDAALRAALLRERLASRDAPRAERGLRIERRREAFDTS